MRKLNKNKIKIKLKSIKIKSQPQYKGICLKVFLVKPKKPNSALRKAAKVQFSTGVKVNAYIPGIGHNISQHSLVLVKKAKTQDLPGFNYKVIRGVLDAAPVTRLSSRSKYGFKNPKTK